MVGVHLKTHRLCTRVGRNDDESDEKCGEWKILFAVSFAASNSFAAPFAALARLSVLFAAISTFSLGWLGLESKEWLAKGGEEAKNDR